MRSGFLLGNYFAVQEILQKVSLEGRSHESCNNRLLVFWRWHNVRERRTTESEGQLNTDSKEVVKLSLGILATLAALVLGLLIASAKTTYSAREGEINQITAYVILLDNLLAKYGKALKRHAPHCASYFAHGQPNLERSPVGRTAAIQSHGRG
jgi:hypothetical protein